MQYAPGYATHAVRGYLNYIRANDAPFEHLVGFHARFLGGRQQQRGPPAQLI